MSAATPEPCGACEYERKNPGVRLFEGHFFGTAEHPELSQHFLQTGLTMYDAAVATLAQFLPDGWITQDDDGVVCFTHANNGAPEIVCEEDFYFWGSGADYDGLFTLPACESWRESRREIKERKVVL